MTLSAEGKPDTAVDVVAEAMRRIFGKESVSAGIELRARQIVDALEKSGHLRPQATPSTGPWSSWGGDGVGP